jgi:hypothetical protein
VLAAAIPRPAPAQRCRQPIAVVDPDRIFRECTPAGRAAEQLQTRSAAPARARNSSRRLQTEGQHPDRVNALNGRSPTRA